MVNKPQLLFFQFPASLPFLQSESVAEADMDTSEDDEADDSKSKGNYKKRSLESICGSRLKDLPGGLMGKILVYKSGKVKMRLGDALFDVGVQSSPILYAAFPVQSFYDALKLNTLYRYPLV
jgi:DNA-directed RNA polymerase III subunit RPC4